VELSHNITEGNEYFVLLYPRMMWLTVRN